MKTSGEKCVKWAFTSFGYFPKSLHRPLKRLSHQFQFCKKWYYWNEKNRKRTADWFLIFCYVSDFQLSLMKPQSFEEMGRKCPIYVETWWVKCRSSRSPCVLLAGDTVGNAPISSLLLFGHFPKCIHYFVSLA
jgi:hypothetical protein